MKKQKILYRVTQAGENTEMALLPFMHAVDALSMEIEAVVVLMANSIWLAKKDYAKHIRYPDKLPLDELIQNFLDLGAGSYVLKTIVGGRCGLSNKNVRAASSFVWTVWMMESCP